MLQCDNIGKTLNFITDSFLLSDLPQRGSCTEFFSVTKHCSKTMVLT